MALRGATRDEVELDATALDRSDCSRDKQVSHGSEQVSGKRTRLNGPSWRSCRPAMDGREGPSCRELKAAGQREGALSSTTSRVSTKSKLATTKTEQASAHLEL